MITQMSKTSLTFTVVAEGDGGVSLAELLTHGAGWLGHTRIPINELLSMTLNTFPKRPSN